MAAIQTTLESGVCMGVSASSLRLPRSFSMGRRPRAAVFSFIYVAQTARRSVRGWPQLAVPSGETARLPIVRPLVVPPWRVTWEILPEFLENA